MKTLTHKKANFESLLDTAILIERRCTSMRGENEEGYYMGSEEEENLTLAELIDRELGPKTDVPYEDDGDDPRANSKEYDMDEEEETLDIFSNAMDIATKAPSPGIMNLGGKLASSRTKNIMKAADQIAGAMGDVANAFVRRAKNL